MPARTKPVKQKRVLLSKTEKYRLLVAREHHDKKEVNVSGYTRSQYQLTRRSAAARMAKWEALEDAMHRLLSHVEKYGGTLRDLDRLAALKSWVDDAQVTYDWS